MPAGRQRLFRQPAADLKPPFDPGQTFDAKRACGSRRAFCPKQRFYPGRKYCRQSIFRRRLPPLRKPASRPGRTPSRRSSSCQKPTFGPGPSCRRSPCDPALYFDPRQTFCPQQTFCPMPTFGPRQTIRTRRIPQSGGWAWSAFRSRNYSCFDKNDPWSIPMLPITVGTLSPRVARLLLGPTNRPGNLMFSFIITHPSPGKRHIRHHNCKKT